MHADLSPPSCPCWTCDPWLVDPNVNIFVYGGGTPTHAQDEGNTDLYMRYSRDTATECSCDQKIVGPTSCAKQPAPPHFVSSRVEVAPETFKFPACSRNVSIPLLTRRRLPRIDRDDADRWTCASAKHFRAIATAWRRWAIGFENRVSA